MSAAVGERMFAEMIRRQPGERWTSVVAELAPLGVQLWPTTSPEFANRFTLARVETVREVELAYVVWTFVSGGQRRFRLGQKVTCEFPDSLPRGVDTVGQ